MASLCLLPLASAQGELTEIGVHDQPMKGSSWLFLANPLTRAPTSENRPKQYWGALPLHRPRQQSP